MIIQHHPRQPFLEARAKTFRRIEVAVITSDRRKDGGPGLVSTGCLADGFGNSTGKLPK